MKTNINAVKVGNVVNISIGGKLHKKNCGDAAEANELFKLVLKAKADPSDENIKTIRAYLNEKIRVALLAGFETDLETGQVFMAGFNTPVPETLIEVIKEYHENDYPMDAIVNFWKLLMINPDLRVRNDLFDFIKTHDFVLTDNGYMVVYKAVYLKKQDETPVTDFAAFISNQYLHVKKTWKTNPNRYLVYRKLDDMTLEITKLTTAENWDEKEKNIEFLGNLGELFESIFNGEIETEVETPVYTDMHSRTMTIELGKPVIHQRTDCNADPRIECSTGLHVGATKYVESFASNSGIVLVCYVNPANVVAVPLYDHSKMRVSEYFPFAIAKYENRKIDIIEQAYFESDYCEYEVEELERQITKIHSEELPIQTAKKAEAEPRPMAELLKILETRLVDLNN